MKYVGIEEDFVHPEIIKLKENLQTPSPQIRKL